ncbi:MAG: FtsW/RodA/SpoVE family cell cycle protein [Bacilli bacterium]
MIKHRINRKLFIIIIMLVIFGLFMVYSASNVVALYRYDDKAYLLKRQLIFAIIGIAIMILFIHIDIRKIYKATTYIYVAALIMLILVLIPGIGVVRGGARSWIGFGSFSIQPAEFMKLAIILLIAKYLSNHHKDLKKPIEFIKMLI